MKCFSAQKLFRIILSLAVLAVPFLIQSQISIAATLGTVSLQLNDARPGQVATSYSFTYTPVTTTAIKTITYVFCTTASGTCTTPTMTTTGGAQGTYSGLSGTTPTSVFTTNGTITTTVGTPATQALSPISVTFTGITNPSTANTYFVQITTKDAGAATIDSQTVAFATTSGIATSVTVDPTLTFAVNTIAASQTVNGATTTVATTSTPSIPFGSVSTSANGIAANSLVVSTNAQSGYTVYIKYTATPNDGNGHTIADVSGATNASPATFSAAGTSAFGYTTESTTLGTGTANRFSGGKWAAFTTSNAEVAHASGAVSSDTTKVGYQVGVGATQPAGTYTTTVVLTATPTY